MSGTRPEEPFVGTGLPTPVVAIPVQQLPPGGIAQQASSTAGTTSPVLPGRRMAAELEWYWRVVAAVVGVVTLAYAFLLGWHETAEGVATAAAFAVALFTLIFALAGVVPASVKVGDVEVKLQQAKEEGKKEGAEQGGLQGVKVGAALAARVQRGEIQADDVGQALKTALMTDKPLELDLPAANVQVPMPKLEDEKAADVHAQEITSVLRTMS